MASSIATGTTIITDTGLNDAYNRGPITSLFVPPSSCTATATLVNQQTDLFVGHYGFSIYHDPSCYPTGANGPSVLASGSVTNWDNYFYSPAICPSGWNVVGRFSSLAIGPATTAQLCCPSGYAYLEGQHICDSTVTSGQTLVVKLYTSASTTFSSSLTTITQTSTTSIKMNAIPIMFQASDSAVLARATNTSPATASMSPTASPSTTDTPSSSSGGLSTGANIGLGVGIPVAVIALLAMGFLLWKRRQKSRTAQQNTEYKDAPHAHGNTQQGAYQQETYEPENYHQGQPHHEMPTGPFGGGNSHELPATRH